MAAVTHGKYMIHLYPGPGMVGGSYATVNEPNKPVKLYAMGPKFFDKQEWLLTYGNDQGKFRIFSTLNGSLLSTTDPTGVPSGPVIAFVPPELSPGSKEHPVITEQNWYITPVESETDIYTIRPVTRAVGMDYYLGHDGVDMCIQSFDIRDTQKRRPQWELIRSK